MSLKAFDIQFSPSSSSAFRAPRQCLELGSAHKLRTVTVRLNCFPGCQLLRGKHIPGLLPHPGPGSSGNPCCSWPGHHIEERGASLFRPPLQLPHGFCCLMSSLGFGVQFSQARTARVWWLERVGLVLPLLRAASPSVKPVLWCCNATCLGTPHSASSGPWEVGYVVRACVPQASLLLGVVWILGQVPHRRDQPVTLSAALVWTGVLQSLCPTPMMLCELPTSHISQVRRVTLSTRVLSFSRGPASWWAVGHG